MEQALLNPLPEREASQRSALALAYLGDTVWDLLVRSELIATGLPVGGLHKAAVALVNARAQRLALDEIEGSLTEGELAIVKRGQNAHARHMPPKNQDPVDYSRATALEALIGYLYLTGQQDRITELYRMSRFSRLKEG